MTIEERNAKLKKYITCLKCEVSGKVCDANCPTQYDAGNMGEIIENLEAIALILDQRTKGGHWVKGYTFPDGQYWKCDKCKEYIKVRYPMKFCSNCGDMKGETL